MNKTQDLLGLEGRGYVNARITCLEIGSLNWCCLSRILSSAQITEGTDIQNLHSMSSSSDHFPNAYDRKTHTVVPTRYTYVHQSDYCFNMLSILSCFACLLVCPYVLFFSLPPIWYQVGVWKIVCFRAGRGRRRARLRAWRRTDRGGGRRGRGSLLEGKISLVFLSLSSCSDGESRWCGVEGVQW